MKSRSLLPKTFLRNLIYLHFAIGSFDVKQFMVLFFVSRWLGVIHAAGGKKRETRRTREDALFGAPEHGSNAITHAPHNILKLHMCITTKFARWETVTYSCCSLLSVFGSNLTQNLVWPIFWTLNLVELPMFRFCALWYEVPYSMSDMKNLLLCIFHTNCEFLSELYSKFLKKHWKPKEKILKYKCL